MKFPRIFVVIFIFVSSCMEDKSERNSTVTLDNDKVGELNQIIIISKNAPEKYYRSFSEDSLGATTKDASGPKFIVSEFEFTYRGSQNRIETWKPEVNALDTLVVEVYTDYLELSTTTPFTLQKQTYLLNRGDTVIFSYEEKFPIAKILNRDTNYEELNYSRIRLKELFGNKHPSHFRMTLGNSGNKQQIKERGIIEYRNALNDTWRELRFIDSLLDQKLLDSVNWEYRFAATTALMTHHTNNRQIQLWLKDETEDFMTEKFPEPFVANLEKSDSLLAFHHFRDYLKSITSYDLPTITGQFNSGGNFYLDSRIRFDSIINDKRFDQLTRNFLLLDAYNGIGKNFGVKDKEKYFKKLQEEVSDRESVKQLQKKYNLDFSTVEKMVLEDPKGNLTSYADVVAMNKGKIILFEFWASWCTPCKNLNPQRGKLFDEMKHKDVVLIRLAMNDIKNNWKTSIMGSEYHDYFILNANVSQVIEELGIKTIPHFILYNTEGKVVEGFAKWPGQGIREQINSIRAEDFH